MTTLAEAMRKRMTKEAFIPAQPPQPPPPPMDPAMGGAPPMDPAMAGAPPMDPAMGGQPPMQPGMDPAMGGAPPMQPGMEGQPQGGDELDQVPIGSMPVSVFIEMIAEVMSRIMADGGAPPQGGEAPAPQGDEGGKATLDDIAERMTVQEEMMGAMMDAMGMRGAPAPQAGPPPDAMPKMAGEKPPVDTHSMWLEQNERRNRKLRDALRRLN
jgi:hypothetical protein